MAERTLLPLADRHGRVATDLRVSLTDRCNLRCTYCMPAEGLPWLPKDEILSNDELLRLIRIGVERLGITTVRLTGGEPLLRPDLEDLVAGIAALEPRPGIALTSNGIGLARRAEGLAAAGLNRVNISLDTLQPEVFRQLSRRNRLGDVLAGVAAARLVGLDPVKINTVLMRGVNHTEAADLVAWAMKEGVQLRFIEQMPLDAQHGWDRSEMVTAAEAMELVAERFELAEDAEVAAARGSAPAELFRVVGTPHQVGFIAAVTRPFCGNCDRVRLTADGQIRNCLFARTESDLRAALRSGAEDAEIAERWRIAVLGKLPGHGIDDPSFLQPDRPMSAIGG
ncbi:GTP 3',8-cyclase MoaA [Enemella evansiae]|uniref:GTP 3',8-cyclase n=1 Tax=Enemella evansiae TaxID=2016499 RepID=A0A255GFH2_9ACTN|nr:GTP 3',8-cyclase MoaA [Enemella evansiae]OYN92959.1 GTP 3',8-cyclase MoaA [Enemella evansiae]OYO04204.1 GTP 3',8-cyclase MoaA [Enemella evansiae]OYO07028.1 GTP 3',8-cyclase MoaA [Enemella evansiae]OYO08449.1 GTP 3',8-cyclase MoaA [Enemella evansiae]OYO14587.1 GTP 3',8-cyclase MoaA [Enemella evansiae]